VADQPDSDQKTQAPTPKRKRDAAVKGDVLQSRELATALVMAAGAGWLALAGPVFVAAMGSVMRRGLTFSRGDLFEFDPWTRALGLGAAATGPLAALFGLGILAAVAGPALLGSLNFRPGGFAPKASKLDPLKGLKRVFGTQGLVELAKSLAKVVVLGGVGWWLISTRIPLMMSLSALDPRRAATEVGGQFVAVVLAMAAALAVIGLIDAPIQYLRRAARLRMTLHEVKEEHRESEGSPETKHMARQRRHEILSSSARRAVCEATVVLTNPTHFAVALRYRPGVDAAPLVIARGRGETAQAIKALAREVAVPQLEYPQLARAIYFTTRSGQPVASDLYLAVATILAFVFNLDRAMAEGVTQPDVAVPPTKAFDELGRRSG
jgi:flagellar biosynthesis protein FlhB